MRNRKNTKIVLLIILFTLLIVPFLYSEENEESESEELLHRMTRMVLQLALIIFAAKIMGFVFKKYFKQSSVLGELIAGMIIGPYALGGIYLPIDIPFIGHVLFEKPQNVFPVSPEIYGLVVIASIILLFFSGLETDLSTFLKFSVKGTLVGVGGVITSFFIGDLLAVIFLPSANGSFFSPQALFLGIISIATSVGITARILSEKRKMSSPEGVTILAGAVLDDVIGIIFLAIVVGISKTTKGDNPAVDWGNIGLIAAKAFGFWLFFTVIGIFFAPKLIKALKKTGSKELIVGISFGIALFLAGFSEMAGLAMIIGAYVVGLSLSQTDLAHEIRNKMSSLYSFFVPVFFCVMGMMVNFSTFLKPVVLIFGLIYVAGAIMGKIIGCGLPALLAGFNIKGAFRIGAGMLPRGEVTLIIAGIGLSAGVIDQDIFGVAIFTLFVASIISPPILLFSFKGGNGLRKKMVKESPGKEEQILLELPSRPIADFVCSRIQHAFRNEEFFVHQVDFGQKLYQIRKDTIYITLIQNDSKVILSSSRNNKKLIQLVLLEEIIELKDFFDEFQKVKDLDGMKSELVSGIIE